MQLREDEILSGEELEILKEVMNIAFGEAAANLSDVIDTRVILNVPSIRIMDASNVTTYIKDNIKHCYRISIVEQQFWGKFQGDALLVLSSQAGTELIYLLQQENNTKLESDPLNELERETLMEFGNIIIGACIGRITELLNEVVTYTPPMIFVEKAAEDSLSLSRYEEKEVAVVLRTDFEFESKNIAGFLFIIVNYESVEWLKNALHNFVEELSTSC